MPKEIREVATRFVDLALKYGRRWFEMKTLPAEEVEILFDVVSAAGFKPEGVVLGMLRGNHRDEDGSKTGETFPVNELCSYKVVNKTREKYEDDYSATRWLDDALRRVVLGFRWTEQEDRETLIKVMIQGIERSVPLEPIQITAEGDVLLEYPPGTHGFGSDDHTRDDHKLDGTVGVHKYCNGWMDRKRATETRDVIMCRLCNLRVYFSREVKTYGELRKALAKVCGA